MSGDDEHVVIIGNGIAGTTAARSIRKLSDARISIVSDESHHFYSRPALMYIYMAHMEYKHTKPYEDWFWDKNRLELVKDWAVHIDTQNKKVKLQGGDPLRYDKLILATGAKHNMFGWPGQDLEGVQGFTNLWDLAELEKHSSNAKRAVIVGGGLIGIEVAEMLRTRGIEVTFLVREEKYWSNVIPHDESVVVEDHIREHHIDLQLGTELKEIHGDHKGHVEAVTTSKGERIECQIVVLAAGVSPRIDLAKESGIPTGRGILVNEMFESEIEDVYAIGDCAERPNRQIDLLWYTGRAHGEHVAQVINGSRRPYEAGAFYNSAKFLDIEYQTYGRVPNDANHHNSWTWKGKDGRRFLRIVHEHGHVVAFNALGLRLRAEQCHAWIDSKAPLETVLQELHKANFDPEFFTTVRDIQRATA